jgi:hypothetical protein
MPRTHFFKQTERCLRLADGCTDPAMAERLRELAAEFRAKGVAPAYQQTGGTAETSPEPNPQQGGEILKEEERS